MIKPPSPQDDVSQVRVKRAERLQVELRFASLNEMIPSDHRVRSVWAFVEGLDLSPLYKEIKAVEGHVGRDAVDPKILMALWLFATIEGVGSARLLARLCERDLAYMWICGGVGVNYHLLSDFRTGHGEFLDQLLTNSIATLLHRGIVTLETVAQDGMRVRANAGTSSFRTKPTLEAYRQQAAEQVQKLREEANDEQQSSSANAREKAARERAARERLERVDQALNDLKELEQQKEARKKGTAHKARCSTTDPQARKMKMANGGFSPAYNVQFAPDAKRRMIVSVDVSNNGSDGGQMAPRHEDIKNRYGRYPEKYLVDGGFSTKNDITLLERRGTQVFAPILQEDFMRARGNDPHARQPGDSDEMFTFRQRMATDQAKQIYKQRSSVAEFPNAECRNRGLQRFLVRGLSKVRTIALWHAITFNFMRSLTLECLQPVS
jgi:transposase